MMMRISITAAGLALAGSLLAQTQTTDQQKQEMLDKLKAEAQALAAQAAGGRGGAMTSDPTMAYADALKKTLAEFQLIGAPGVVVMPLNWEAPLVSGHPYSATIREVTYSPDGSHIDRSHTEMIYRDDQGRTRRESEGGKQVTILDPAAGVAYTLDAEHKLAMKRPLAPQQIANQSKVPTQTPFERATAQAANRPNMSVEDLGTQVVAGVSAQGVRMTTTTPIGAVGNDRELKTVVDRWVSQDLHVLVKSVTTDSRTGSTKYELTNLMLASPDASLFQVPAGYMVQEGGRGARGGSLMPAPTQPGGRGK